MTVTVRRRPISLRTRFAVLSEAGFRCQYCGRRPPEAVLQVDHVVPLASGGTDDRSNLVASCWACNNGKGIKTLHQPKWTPVGHDIAPGVMVPTGRCANERHPGPWIECAYPMGYPALALVCETCTYVVAWRPQS